MHYLTLIGANSPHDRGLRGTSKEFRHIRSLYSSVVEDLSFVRRRDTEISVCVGTSSITPILEERSKDALATVRSNSGKVSSD